MFSFYICGRNVSFIRLFVSYNFDLKLIQIILLLGSDWSEKCIDCTMIE